MRILSGRKAARAVERLSARSTQLSALEPKVRNIIRNIRRSGDAALLRYAQRWDGLSSNQPFRVEEAELSEALERLPAQTRKSLRQAAQNIRRFAEWQKPMLVAKAAVGRTGVPVEPHAVEDTVHAESAAPKTFAVLVSGTGHGSGLVELIVRTSLPFVAAWQSAVVRYVVIVAAHDVVDVGCAH